MQDIIGVYAILTLLSFMEFSFQMSAHFIWIIHAAQSGLKVMRITLFFEEQRKKSWTWGAISSYDNTSLYLYEESFNANTYINILQEAIHEMRDFKT